MNGQNDAVKPEVGTCGPGCNCRAPGIGKRSKWLISGVVMLAACGVAAVKILGTREDAPQAQGFAMPAAVTTSVLPASASPATWGAPLTGMADLNVVATNSDAVFVVIPSDDAARMDTIRKEVDAATSRISEKGTQVGKFLLSKDAEDYKGVVAQIGAPAVLSMVKGRGMAAVADKEVTKDALLKAFVGASRPRSGCGPSGCGPSSAGCQQKRCCMEWFRSLLTSATAAFDQAGVGFAAIPIAFALGLLSAVVSACCTLPVLGIIVGYAGARKDTTLRARLMSAGSFSLGAVLSLVILGAVAAMVGQVAQGILGRYWKVFAGFVAIVMGLGALNLLPFKLPQRKAKFGVKARSGGVLGALLFGIVGGGAVSVSSLACNPGIFIIIGAAVLQGVTLWMTAILVAYAFGFALPLGALMVGVSFGAAAVKFKGVETVVRGLAGVLLVAVGFYFLWSY